MSVLADIIKATKILSETFISGSSISTCVDDKKAGICSYFHKKPYFMELFIKNYPTSVKDDKRVEIVSCSQIFENEALLVDTELIITSIKTSEEMAVRVHLTIPNDTYLVRKMICIPELVKQLLSGGSLTEVLKINSFREGELIWNL